MSDSLANSIQRVLLESADQDLSGRYTLFALYADNTSVLHIIEDRETYEAMKHRFTSNDGIKRLGASRLPENTTFKKLSESLERKFGVPRESISVRSHAKQAPQPKKEAPRVVNEMQKPRTPQPKAPPKGSVLEGVLKGRERFTNAPMADRPVQKQAKQEPTINSFRPAHDHKIDLKNLNSGDRPMLG